MSRKRNTFEKHRRDTEKRFRAEAKRKKRLEKKNQSNAAERPPDGRDNSAADNDVDDERSEGAA